MHDAVIVLANQMDANGNLNEESQGRLTLACRLVQSGAAPLLVTTGWAYRDDSDICVADAMARHAVEHLGMDQPHILIDRNSRDTVGDAVFTKRNLANRFGWKSVLAVTTGYHVERTRQIFTFIYGQAIEVVGSEGQNSPTLAQSEAQSLTAFRSTFEGVAPGDDEAIYQRLKTAHPFYNGKIYPMLP